MSPRHAWWPLIVSTGVLGGEQPRDAQLERAVPVERVVLAQPRDALAHALVQHRLRLGRDDARVAVEPQVVVRAHHHVAVLWRRSRLGSVRVGWQPCSSMLGTSCWTRASSSGAFAIGTRRASVSRPHCSL